MSDVMPDSEAPETPSVAIPLKPEVLGQWKRRIEQSKKLLETFKEDWKDAVQAYLGKPLSNDPTQDTVVVPKEFSFLEQKKS